MPRKNQVHTPEARLKISMAKKGIKPSQNTIDASIRAHLGKKQSPETIEKRRLANTGKKRSEEFCRRLSELHKGRVSPFKGTKNRYSQETLDKMRETAIKNGNHPPRKYGEEHWNWKGGVVPLIKKIRFCLRYRQWVSDVFQIDDYVCQMCNVRGGKLVVDHYPTTFADIFYRNEIKSLEQALECEEFWNLNNGRTLCFECHRKTPTYGRAWRYQK